MWLGSAQKDFGDEIAYMNHHCVQKFSTIGVLQCFCGSFQAHMVSVVMNFFGKKIADMVRPTHASDKPLPIDSSLISPFKQHINTFIDMILR